MSRVASIVLLVVGTVLCVTWLVTPASSSPQTAAAPHATEPAGTADDVDVESVRLEAVTSAPRFVAPRRDPFTFRSRPSIDRPTRTAPESAAVTPAAPPVQLPTLVAIVKERSGDTDLFRAVLSSDGFNVTMVAAGQSFAGFVVVDVRSDGLTLKHSSSSEQFAVPLR